jgi:hypothetical protein
MLLLKEHAIFTLAFSLQQEPVWIYSPVTVVFIPEKLKLWETDF